jgi:multidrug efflux pump
LPAVRGQQLNATIVGPSRLRTLEEFGRILLKVNTDGSQVRLSDVTRIELGGQSYDINSYYNGKPAAGLAIKLATGTNALDTVEAVRHRIQTLQPFFPPGMDVVYPYDTAPFVELSIEEVFKTLGEAIILVFLVMCLFLQNVRATLIPTLAVPVVLLGTFGVLAAFGYSINTLTMFGMVLAIGLLVDDAIVVVENVERVRAEEGLSPRQATRKSMEQITGALVGIAMVLAAVFVPMAFFGGSTRVIYRQFSITIVSSMVLSVIVAVIFTPALCATLLKPIPKGHHAEKTGFFGWFKRMFERSNQGYVNTVSRGLSRTKRLMLVYLVIVLVMAWMFTRILTAFCPMKTKVFCSRRFKRLKAQAPNAPKWSSMPRRAICLKIRKTRSCRCSPVNRFNFGGRGQNASMLFIKLRDWSERGSASQKIKVVAQRANAHFAKTLRDARVFVIAPPSVMELGNASGFDFQLVD